MDKCKPIPDYVGIYWMFADGRVKNAKGRIIKPINGCVTLRKYGTKEIFQIDVLKLRIYGG